MGLAMLASAAGALMISQGQGVAVHGAGRPYAVRYDAAADTLRFELRPGDRWPGDGDSKVKERAEIATAPVPAGQVMRVNFALTVLPGEPNTAKWLVLAQVQRRDTAGSFVGFPIFSLELKGEHLRWAMRGGDPKAPTYRMLWVDPQPVRRGEDYAVALELRCAAEGGYALFWMDGVQRAAVKGENPCFADTAATYFKTGIYRAPAPETVATVVKGLVVRPSGPPAPR